MTWGKGRGCVALDTQEGVRYYLIPDSELDLPKSLLLLPQSLFFFFLERKGISEIFNFLL